MDGCDGICRKELQNKISIWNCINAVSCNNVTNNSRKPKVNGEHKATGSNSETKWLANNSHMQHDQLFESNVHSNKPSLIIVKWKGKGKNTDLQIKTCRIKNEKENHALQVRLSELIWTINNQFLPVSHGGSEPQSLGSHKSING